jgi:hypothetical protein
LHGLSITDIEDEVGILDRVWRNFIPTRSEKLFDSFFLLERVARVRHRVSKIELVRTPRLHQLPRHNVTFLNLLLKLRHRELVKIRMRVGVISKHHSAVDPFAQQSNTRFTVISKVELELVYKTDCRHLVFLQRAENLCRCCSRTRKIRGVAHPDIRQIVDRDGHRACRRLRPRRYRKRNNKEEQKYMSHKRIHLNP